jgi:hypothetical protein
MLRSNREPHIAIQLTSGVAVGYTANLRCTLNVLDYLSPRGVPQGVLCVR